MAASLACDGGLATLWLDRPERRNALDLATWHSMPELLGQAIDRRETRVIVVRGAGGNFAAGADIAEFDAIFADRVTTLDYLAAMTAATAAIEAAPVPVIACIEGLCIGAGVAVAAACDLRLSADDARFAITPAKLGLMYSLADTRRVVAAVGISTAKNLLFTGRTVDAKTAERIGLVDEVHPCDLLEEALREIVDQIGTTSGWTHSRTKAVMRRILEGATHDDADTRSWFADAVEGADYREGLAAFRARRPARFGCR